MKEPPARLSGRWWPLALVGVVGFTIAGGIIWKRGDPDSKPIATSNGEPNETTGKIRDFCGSCHAYPPPEILPRAEWGREITRGFRFAEQASMTDKAPHFEAVFKHYLDQAPAELPSAVFENATTPMPAEFQRLDFPGLRDVPTPYISNVQLVHLFDPKRLDVLACDMKAGAIMVLRPYEPNPAWKVLLQMRPQDLADAPFHPAHAEVIDLDGDGIKDILVSNLGSFTPTDLCVGSVILLRGRPDGSFTPHTLLQGVGRVADVRAADFRGTGKLDLVVAVFGLHQVGEVLMLENQTTDWASPRFEPRQLDARHGAIHVPVADLNGDGRPDFVALFSQEHETIVAFLNEGNGRFRKETIHTGPHPAMGSSGIELVDFDGDGDLDVLYTNGDALDPPYLLKPYHSVQWLENRGIFPFTHHLVTPMYGAHRALAADFAGRGRKDIIAVGFLPEGLFPQRLERKVDSILYLEQMAPGKFARHSLEKVSCDHVTAAVGDIWGRGRTDFVTATFGFKTTDRALTIWKNLGPTPASAKAHAPAK